MSSGLSQGRADGESDKNVFMKGAHLIKRSSLLHVVVYVY